MTDRTWHKGPPPHEGWWVASYCSDDTCWRWWDGYRWSPPAYPELTAKQAEESVRRFAHIVPGSLEIEWTDYYPKDARVPRIDPRKFQQSKE